MKKIEEDSLMSEFNIQEIPLNGTLLSMADNQKNNSCYEEFGYLSSNKSDPTSIPVMKTEYSQDLESTDKTFDSNHNSVITLSTLTNVGFGTTSQENILIIGREISVTCKRKQYQCNICAKSFVRKSSYNRHMMTHTGERPYKCTVCEKRFLEKAGLTIHFRIHTGERPYSCSYCPKTFRHRSNFRLHERRHFDDRRYSCHVCGKKFISQGNSRRHLMTHTGDKYFKCDRCQRDFKNQKALTVHMRIHENQVHGSDSCLKDTDALSVSTEHCENTIKPYNCNHCRKSYAHFGSLKVHIRTHTGEKPFRCTVCQKDFNRSGTLTSHMNIHAGARPHKCDVCQKAFSSPFTLTLHKRVHSGERPYECDICKRKFSQMSNLKRHQRTKHKS